MSLLFKVGLIIIFFFSAVFASWRVIHGDIHFSADIARDFHLFREVSEKGLVLIGPRSSTGLFHGPAWTYLNYPAFLLGGGNPIVVGWFWVALSAGWVASNYFIAKDLFGRLSGAFFAAMTAVYVGYHAGGFFNPHGAMLLIPLYFYLFIKYLRNKNIKLLALHFLVGGVILQFQLALGVPFLMLSSVVVLLHAIKRKNHRLLAVFLLLPLMVANFIIFDLRHDGLYREKLFGFVQPQEKGELYNYLQLVDNRISLALNGTEILRHDAYGYLNLIFFGVILALCMYFIRKNKHKDVYLAFLYFYFGFFILSFIDKGPILYFYIFPLFPLVFLIMSSFLDTKLKNYLVIPLAMILLINMSNAVRDMKDALEFKIGKVEDSWSFMKKAGDFMFETEPGDFGFYVFSPDSFAYQGRYTMIYLSEKYGRGEYFEKKPVTYIFAAPTPENEFITGDKWWTENRVKIQKQPVMVVDFNNGYKIEKYELSEDEVNTPTEGNLDTGLHFR